MDEKVYSESVYEEALALLKALCLIPAPSHGEGNRAEYVRAWMVENGGQDVTVDGAMNVIWKYNVTDDNDLFVIEAHTDTVFPDTEPMPYMEDEENIYSPGVTDDTGNLVALLLAAREFIHDAPHLSKGLLVVANSCEEGLGNLKGTKEIFAHYGNRIKAFLTVDGARFENIVAGAVGSERYRVSVKTEGGHSFSAFGNRNAIHVLSLIINDLYSQTIPEKDGCKTTYNVGTIEGGTSVNTIAEEASMLYEYRSNDLECIGKMKNSFYGIIEKYRMLGFDVEVDEIGVRPAGREATEEMREYLSSVGKVVGRTIGKEPKFTPGSTDANIPLSLGIPACCVTGAEGGGTHTRGEWLRKESLKTGVELVLALMRTLIS